MSTNRSGRPPTRLVTPRFVGPAWALELLSALWSTAAAIPPLSTGAAAAYRTLFVTVRRLMLGRRITVRWDRGELTMNVTEFESHLDVRELALGLLPELRLVAREISWGTAEFDSAQILAGTVQVRPGPPPVLVAAPVYVTLDIAGAALGEVLRAAGSRFSAAVDADGSTRIALAGRPGWGQLEVDASLDGPELALQPRGLWIRGRRWRVPARLRPYRVAIPDLPDGLILTDVTATADGLRVTATMPEWQLEFTRSHLELLLHQLRTARMLTLNRLSR